MKIHGNTDYRSRVAVDRCVGLLIAGAAELAIAGQDDDLIMHVVAAPRVAHDFFGEPMGSELDNVVRTAVHERRLRWRSGEDDIGKPVLRLADVATGVALDVHVTLESLVPTVVELLRARGSQSSADAPA